MSAKLHRFRVGNEVIDTVMPHWGIGVIVKIYTESGEQYYDIRYAGREEDGDSEGVQRGDLRKVTKLDKALK